MAVALEHGKPTLGAVWKAGALAAVVSAVVNTILFYGGAAFGAFPTDIIVPNSGRPLTVVPVIAASVIGALGGTIVYAILSRFMQRSTTHRVFMIIALVVLLLSFFMPFSIPGAPAAMLALLEIMHVVVAAATVYFLLRA